MEKVKVVGSVKIRAGKEKREGHNLVVDQGHALIAKLVGGTGTAPSHIAAGDDATATTVSMTALQGVEKFREALTASPIGNELTLTATHTAAAQMTLREVGIFNAAVAGEMLARFVIADLAVPAGQTVEVEWTLAFGE